METAAIEAEAERSMSWLDALILGIVEGITEFLPVSSTGHLDLTNAVLQLDGRAVDAYAIVIQFGAILAVVALYKQRAYEILQGFLGKFRPTEHLLGKNEQGFHLGMKLGVAFIPIGIAGLTLADFIGENLRNPVPVSAALILGGIVMIGVEQFVVKPRARKNGGFRGGSLKEVDDMTYFDAIFIGIAQCFALWPGTSRAMATIVGAQLRGFSSVGAAEVSFLLALPTITAAAGYEMVMAREALLEELGWGIVIFGNLVAFGVAYLAVKWFINIVTHYGMTPFGIYRILLGAVFLWLGLRGALTFVE